MNPVVLITSFADVLDVKETQGLPNSISMEDELMRRFGAERTMAMLDRFGMDDSTPIQSKMVSKAVESSQKRVEGNNFDSRKQLLQYDDVLRQQREVIYKQRFEVIDSDNLKSIVINMIQSSIERAVGSYTPKEELPEEWKLDGLVELINTNYLDEGAITVKDIFGKEADEITSFIMDRIKEKYDAKEETFGEEQMREFEKVIVLRAVDSKWMDHIDAMDQLRQGIHLRAYAQTNPLREYQMEGFAMFEHMVASIEDDVAKYVLKSEIQNNLEREEVVQGQTTAHQPQEGDEEKTVKKKPVRKVVDIGRNSPCHCGSGKKYKIVMGRQNK